MSDTTLFSVPVERARRRLGVKWSRYGDDVVPAWVADMDYDPPAAVTEALHGHLNRGDLGYASMSADLPEAYAAFQQRHHGWLPDPSQVRVFTSALHALEAAIWNTTEPGDGVVVLTPVYYPFLDAVRDSGRRLVDAPLDPDGWRIDPDRLDAAIDPRTRVILFCTPHNPTGRVFEPDEIAAVADVAERHDLLVVTDEIWGELTHGPRHRPLATCDERFAGRLVTLGSASKSFNLAGLRCAVAVVDHAPLERALDAMSTHLQGAPSTLGVVGTLAAWTECDDWLAAVRVELTARRDQLARRLAADAPAIGFEPPEATYLGWLDFRATDLGDDPARALLKRGRVALSQGPKFGTGGTGFARVNFATSAEILDDIVDRVATTVAAAVA